MATVANKKKRGAVMTDEKGQRRWMSGDESGSKRWPARQQMRGDDQWSDLTISHEIIEQRW
jgi:hypothetical protein